MTDNTYEKSLIVFVDINESLQCTIDFSVGLFLEPSSKIFTYLCAGPYLI